MRKNGGKSQGGYPSRPGAVAVKPVKKHAGFVPAQGRTVTIGGQIYSLTEQNHYLQATLLLELDATNRTEKQAGIFLDEVKARIPQVRDLVVKTVREKTFREVNTSQGKETLKGELLVQINEILKQGELKHILFTSYAVN